MLRNKPTIFISHATWRKNSRIKTKKILEKLNELLEADDWDVFIDRKKLAPGEQWRPTIISTLSNAVAGVILFDKIAVKESNWVKVETLIMCYRKATNPDFQLIPVLLEDLRPDDDCFGLFNPLQLFETGCLLDEDEQVHEICEKIRTAVEIKKSKSNSAVNSWIITFENWLSDVLKNHSLRETILRELWHSLQDLIEDTADKNNPLAYREELLIRAITQLLHHLGPLETLDILNKIKYYKQSSINQTELDTIRELIKVKWVENRWIEIFFNSTRKDHNKLLLGWYRPIVGLQLLKHIKCFFSRLEYERQPDQYIKAFTIAETAGETDEAILYHIEKEISVRFGSDYPLGSNHHKNFINECLSEGNTIYLIYIPQSLAKKSVLSNLKSRYPQMLILIDVDFTEPQNQFEDLEMEFLKPLLTPEKINELSKITSRF